MRINSPFVDTPATVAEYVGDPSEAWNAVLLAPTVRESLDPNTRPGPDVMVAVIVSLYFAQRASAKLTWIVASAVSAFAVSAATTVASAVAAVLVSPEAK